MLSKHSGCFFVFVIFILFTVACSSPPLTTTVEVTEGTLEGVEQDGVFSYKGIPFAAPPVGDLRWQAPQPPEAWTGVRSADTYARGCMQDSSMAAMTGVERSQADVSRVFTMVRQQLPVVENIEGFLSAHQMGIAQLSIAYCDALVEDATKRTAYFGSFGFTSGVDTAFNTAGGDSAEKNQILNTLYNKMIGLPGTGGGLPTALRSD